MADLDLPSELGTEERSSTWLHLLNEAAEKVREAEAAKAARVRRRDELVKMAHEAGIRPREIIRATRLSRQRVSQIIGAPSVAKSSAVGMGQPLDELPPAEPTS